MKKILILIIFLLSINSAFAQSNYSSSAIQIFNSGVTYHKQHHYEQAEQKYELALKIQPDFAEAKKNLSIVYYTQAKDNLSVHKDITAVAYAQKALDEGYGKVECYHIMANCYKDSGDYNNLILVCDKLNSLTPNDENVLNHLALAYLKTGQIEKSQDVYKKILLMNPKNSAANQNLEYINYKRSDILLTQALNNIQVTEHAPKRIYRMIKRSWRVPKPYVLEAQRIIDLIWSEPTGRKMLLALREEGIPIRIVPNDKKTITMHETQTTTTYAYGKVPLNTMTYYSTTVIIPIKHIDGFNNVDLEPKTRIYHLHAFLHEMGHAYMFTISQNNKDSIEEELGVSMLGYNIANKIVTGEYLTREEIKYYSKGCMIALLKDDHRNLPVFGYFNRKLMMNGVYLPYFEEYADIPIMYKKLLDDGKVSPADTFSPYIYKLDNL
jgi:tetratricopeptide (TPR) repeat protein